MTTTNSIEIVSYTDPYCTWCWGSEPIFRKIEQVYGEQVDINYVMGGLVKDIHDFYDSANNIGGANYYKQVAEHWYDASTRHGMPVDEKIWYETAGEFTSTFPANIAFKAAELQDKQRAKKFLRKMREGIAAERRKIHRIEIQGEMIREVGLDEGKFIAAIESKEAEKAFYNDLEKASNKGVRGFPTFLIRAKKGEEVFLRGYQPYKRFEKVIQQFAEDVKPQELKVTEENILEVFEHYEHVTRRELEEIFAMTEVEAQEWLETLKSEEAITEKKVGNGFFYKRHTNPLLCDPDTGLCSI